MTCLGERLTALVDGELDHDERDRALAHLAVCRACRQEADTMRRLKGRLRALASPPQDPAVAPDLPGDDFLNRLRALGEQRPGSGDASGPPVGGTGAWPPHPGARRVPPLRGPSPMPMRAAATRRRHARPFAGDGGVPVRVGAAAVPVRRRIPRRYLAVGAAAMVLGLGSASYALGGVTEQQPSVVPAFDRLEAEHALTNGIIPMTEMSPAPAPSAPAAP
ncbi:Putative zinc-finger [Thermomonospora echinospora]|uniref:Putative zinc-finger n=1 Tax=Thermomonospora echinospora TaxID=1992 RepID=A0A1H5ZZW2_9ACTN|nr:zf-HC2 domain-containing protein [Thermomonospora echinospora]SEG42063.1 Putative zinc-finger [Thermomonospora echinospora]